MLQPALFTTGLPHGRTPMVAGHCIQHRHWVPSVSQRHHCAFLASLVHLYSLLFFLSVSPCWMKQNDGSRLPPLFVVSCLEESNVLKRCIPVFSWQIATPLCAIFVYILDSRFKLADLGNVHAAPFSLWAKVLTCSRRSLSSVAFTLQRTALCPLLSIIFGLSMFLALSWECLRCSAAPLFVLVTDLDFSDCLLSLACFCFALAFLYRFFAKSCCP